VIAMCPRTCEHCGFPDIIVPSTSMLHPCPKSQRMINQNQLLQSNSSEPIYNTAVASEFYTLEIVKPNANTNANPPVKKIHPIIPPVKQIPPLSPPVKQTPANANMNPKPNVFNPVVYSNMGNPNEAQGSDSISIRPNQNPKPNANTVVNNPNSNFNMNPRPNPNINANNPNLQARSNPAMINPKPQLPPRTS